MGETLKVMAVIGSLHEQSVTRVAVNHVVDGLRAAGCEVDVLDLAAEPLPLVNPDTTFAADYYGPLKARVVAADVFVLGTPDYHGSISGAMKNFLDHFWKEFTGKLFAPMVASHEKGLTAHDQMRTVARQCYAWSLPYAVSFMEKEDVADGKIISDKFRDRLEMMTRDVQVYGGLLATQRQADLADTDPTFLAQLRK
jgi:NAD(P)H-dependent FMN reductase